MSPIQQMLLGAGAGDDPIYLDKVFKQQQYIGTGNQITVNNGIDIATDGGLVWIKRRDSYGHFWFDTARGTSVALSPNLTNPNFSEPNGVNNFNSTGYKIGTNGTSDGAFNATDQEYQSYTFKKQAGFFDIVTYSGNNETAFNVSHNLGVKPGAILIKDTGTNTHKWYWWSKGMDTNMNLKFNTNSEISTDSSYDIGASLTSTHFRVPTGSEVNYQGTYIAYLWADGDEAAAQIFGETGDKPLTKMGTYTGTSGHNDINIGFEPQWLLIKRFDANETEHWFVFDTFKGWGNSKPESTRIQKITNQGEFTESTSMSFTPTPTGFRFESGRSDYNGNNGKYLYMAIRRPDNYVAEPETTATNLYHAVVGQTTSAKPDFLTPFAVDFTLMRQVGQSDDWNLSGRLLTYSKLHTNNTNSQSLHSDFAFDFENGWGDASWSTDRQSWNFKRGQGLDMLVYKGNDNSNRNITHNLNAVPEMMWVKNRDSSASNAHWRVYHKGLNGGTNPAEKYLILNTNQGEQDSAAYWSDTEPTSSVFTVGAHLSVNADGDEILAVLFSSVNGISKVGSYTGNGSSTGPVISLGFEPRFLLFKNASSGGNGWAVLDTVRGLGTSSQKRIWLDGDWEQDSGNNYVTTTSTSFQPVMNNTEFNENGSTIIYYAHA
jgi:hypothetical protein